MMTLSPIPDASALATWRKSRYSENNGGCIEVADGIPGLMPVRDSKNPTGPALTVPATAWSSFVSAVKTSRFPGV